MTMLHDTFCTPSTFDKHHIINETMCTSSHTLRVDTLFRSSNNNTLPPLSLRSSNSSLTTASSISSNEDTAITNEDHHKLVSWVQRQLGFYIALSIIPPRVSCMDDGKLLLCLIHRFAPHSLPRLVTTLEQHTNTECLALADSLAQTLWYTSIDSLAIYLHQYYHNTSRTLGDYVDSLMPPSSPPDPDDDDDDHHAPSSAAATLPTWQHQHDDDDGDSNTKWISATHQSIDSYLHHPQTHRLSILLSLVNQLADIYMIFSRLTIHTASVPTPDYLLPTHRLLGRLQWMENRLASLTTNGDDDDDDDDNSDPLSDLLVQRHAYLQASIQQALGLFEKSNKVQTWVTTQMAATADKVWVEDVRRYRHEGHDVLALMAYVSSSTSFSDKVVARVTKPTVIKALDRLDTLMDKSTQVEQQLYWQSVVAADWDRVYGVASVGLEAWHDSIRQLSQQTISWRQNNNEVTHRSLVQQWKILAARLVRLEHGDYAAVIRLYQKLTLGIKLPAVEKDYATLMQHWKQLPGALEMARLRITQYKRIEDFLHQCHLVQMNAAELERQLGMNGNDDGGGGVINLYDKPWMEDQVDELDKTIARVLASTGGLGGGGDMDEFIHHWKNVLAQCQRDYHQAWTTYQSTWARLEQQRELETIKYALAGQLEALQSSLFDPWTHCMDDMDGLKQGYAERKRHFMHTVVTRFDQLIKKNDGDNDVRTGIEKVEQVLMNYGQRLDILEKRHAWERQWHKANTQVQQTINALHELGSDSSISTMDDMCGYKPDLEPVQNAWDDLLATNNGHQASVVLDRICQRQQLLVDQANELDGLLDATHAMLIQTDHVTTYMTSVDAILEASQSLGQRLESGLLSSLGGEMVDQHEEIEGLTNSAIQLWQDTASHIPYGASFLVVDDLVRWKVLVAYGDVMTAMVRVVVDDLDAYTKRTKWEQQWLLDMDGLKQAQQHLSLWLQQHQQRDHGTRDMEVGILAIVDRYTEYPFHHLEQHFTTMQQAYPVNLKIPLALKQQQQQLIVDTYGQIKFLCGLVTYLHTARQLYNTCDDMNATLDHDGVDASEDLVEQWMEKIKVHVEQELFASLCDQQIQLKDGVDTFDKEKVQLVRDKATTVLEDLQDRLTITLKTSQHTRLVQAYGQSASVLESSLHQLQNDLISSTTSEHDKSVPGSSGDVYQERKAALHIKWQEAKLALETVHTGSYNDVRSLCQLIQLQQEESDVVARQTRLDDLWQAVWQDLNGMLERMLSLAQWGDLASSLDKVQAMLMHLTHWMDATTMAIHGVDKGGAICDLSRIYQEAHATLAVVRDFVLRSDKHTEAVLMHRLDDSCDVVDGLRTALICFAHQLVVNERTVVLSRLASWVDMPLFDYDGTQTLVVESWDKVNNKTEASKAIYDKVTPLLALCESKTILSNDKGDNDVPLLEVCRESVDALSKAVEMEQHYLKGLLTMAFECGQQASTLFLGLDCLVKNLADFVLDGTTNELADWRLDIHVWQYKVIQYERTELRGFLDMVNGWLLLISDDTDDDDDDSVKALGGHIRQCMQELVKEVETRWDGIKTQLDNAATEVTSWQLKKLAEQQWQDLLDLLENARNRSTLLMSDFYHDNDPVMLSQEQDLIVAQQALTTLAYETRPVLAMKAKQVKTALDALTTTWIDHVDVDRALDGWEQALQQHQQHLRHNISMCQYWVAAAEVQGNLCVLEQLLDEGDKTKFKVYMDVLDTSLEKTRQAATLLEGSGRTEYALLVAKRNKLERQFNTHQRWLATPTGGSGGGGGGGLQRSRKISLPSKMPSQNLMGRTPNAYVADPQNDLDMEIGRIVNKVPYKVELNMVPGEAGRYRFGSKLVYCRILKSRMVMVRVGGGWTELSQFLRDHALLVGSKSSTTMSRTTTTDGCQEMYLDTKRATSPSGRPLLLPRMSQSTTTATTTTPLSISGNAGYKDGDRYIAVDLQGYQHEMKMTPHDSNTLGRRYS